MKTTTAPFEAPNLRWRKRSVPPNLAPDALHLWRIPLGENPGRLGADDLALLSRKQQQRVRRLRTPQLQRRYLRAHSAMRRILGGYLQRPPQTITLSYGAAGKPSLTGDHRQLEFNLTTSGDLALLAVAAEHEVGVDCEPVRDDRDLAGIAHRMFPADDAVAIDRLPATERALAFYLHWTALEARVKADGRGLAGWQEPDMPGLEIRHAVAGHLGGTDVICAVARRALPPVRDWITLELTDTRPGEDSR